MTEDKFLKLVHKHKAQVYQNALYLLRNREDAEDITQETFIKAWGIPCQITTEDRACVVTEMYAESLF